MMMEFEARGRLSKNIKKHRENTTFEGSKAFGRPKMRLKWAQDGLKRNQDELRWSQDAQEKQDRRQDSANMRRVRDVSSVSAPWRSFEPLGPANSAAGPGEG